MSDLDAVEARITAAMREMRDQLAAEMFKCDPYVGPPPELPRLTVRQRLARWWLDTRERFARSVLRVDLLSDHECDL